MVGARRPARLRAGLRGGTGWADRPGVPRRRGRRRLRPGRRARGGVVDQARPGEHLAYRLSPRLPDGGLAFTSHLDIGLRPTGTGTDLDVHWRITDSAVDSADFVAGIEIGFGQSLDRLAAILAADSPDTDDTNTDMRSTT